MAYGIDLTQDPSQRKSLADIDREVAEGRMNQLKMANAEDERRQQKALETALRRNSRADPSGKVVTDHNGVVRDLSTVAPVLARKYAEEVEKKEQATRKAQMEMVKEALSAVDETQEDQEAAKAQYDRAIDWLKSNGVPIDPEDEEYDPGNVTYMRHLVIGAEKRFTEANDAAEAKMLEDGRNARETMQETGRMRRHYTPSADTLVGEEGKNYRHNTPSADSQLSQEGQNYRATLPARSKSEDEGDGDISFLPPGTPVQMRSGVGVRKDPITGQQRNHKGEDYAAPAGTPILAEKRGQVVFSGRKGGFGNHVRIRYEDGSEISYSHNQANLVREGDTVIKGQPIGRVGSTGRSTGNHVHREVHARTGEIDPAPEGFNEDGEAMNALAPEEDADPFAPPASYEELRTRVKTRPAAPAPVTRKPVAQQPQSKAPATKAAPKGDHAFNTAVNVLNYTGKSRLDPKQGEIGLRTHPAIKSLREQNFEKLEPMMKQLVDVIGKEEINLGTGAGVQQGWRKTLQGIENLFGVNTSSRRNDRQIEAYEMLTQASTLGAIEALRGVGGNDTDRDFDRALSTTVSTLKSGRFNRRAAIMAAGALEIGRKKLDFFEKWANTAGSINRTIDGVTVTDAWGKLAGQFQRQVMQRAEGFAHNAGKKGPPPAQKQPTGFPRAVRGPDGSRWLQKADGSLVRDNR